MNIDLIKCHQMFKEAFPVTHWQGNIEGRALSFEGFLSGYQARMLEEWQARLDIEEAEQKKRLEEFAKNNTQ